MADLAGRRRSRIDGHGVLYRHGDVNFGRWKVARKQIGWASQVSSQLEVEYLNGRRRRQLLNMAGQALQSIANVGCVC